MKKNLLTLICIVFLSSSLKAQVYYPLLDSTNVWSYTTFLLGVRLAHNETQASNCTYTNASYSTAVFYTAEDTVVHAQSYKKLFVAREPSDTCLYGFIREDSSAQKVYFRDVLDSPEVVLYNFAMQIGDSMNIDFVQSPGYFYSGYYTLDSIKYVTIQAGVRRVFYLNTSDANSRTLIWTESVGNLGDAIYPYSNNQYAPFQICPGFPHDFMNHMICFEHSEKVYYDTCTLYGATHGIAGYIFIDSCNYFFFTGAVNNIDPGLSVTVSPNPVQERLTVSGLQFTVKEIEIYNVLGMKTSPPAPLQRRGEQAVIDVSKLTAGVYFLQLKGESGSVVKRFVKE